MKRTKYAMHHNWITAGNIGKLMPIFCQEVTPNDVWNGKSTAMFKMAPLNVPSFITLDIFVHFFFVPHSLSDPDFPDGFTNKDPYTIPEVLSSAASNDVWKYWGIKQNVAHGTNSMNALPFRAYNHVYNQYFRHADRPEVTDFDRIEIYPTSFNSNDYFGSMLSEQLEDGDFNIPSVTSVSTLEVRKSLGIIRMREKRNRYGEDYDDVLASDFGVSPRSLDIDKPLHVARAKTTMGISEVVATATSTGETTGEFKGHGISGMHMKFKPRTFTQHGILLGVMVAKPRLTLKNRLDKHFDIISPQELYAPDRADWPLITVDTREVDNTVAGASFAYQDRHEWLRTARDTIAGEMYETAQDPWTAHHDNASDLLTMQTIPQYDHLFQDQSVTRPDIFCYFDHKIAKHSIIKPRGHR